MLRFHVEAGFEPASNKPIATIALFDPKTTVNSQIAGGVIEIDQNKDLDYFMTQAQHYLQLINSNE